MSKARCKQLLEKSVSAALSAVEVYNKPDFKYREESFVILMVNAWELLLKAKVLSNNNNNLKSLYAEDKSRRKADGTPYAHAKYKKNRAGNYFTIDITKAAKLLNLDTRLLANIELLTEIRDNAIHFYNTSKLFEKKVLEVGTASLRSWVNVSIAWFDVDLSIYNFYLMPISFYHPYEMESFSINKEAKQHQNLLRYIETREDEYPSDPAQDHNISLKLQTKFIKSSDTIGLAVRYDADNPNSIAVHQAAEEAFANKYTWTYEELIIKVRSRYSDFKQTYKFNNIMRSLRNQEEYCKERYLDLKRKTGTKKTYYAPAIFQELDRHYSR